MALTKVTGDFIKAGSITQGHLHSSHGITTTHIAEGDKLFFTNARVDSRVGSLSTSNLSEGTNLYYTNARADARIALQVGSNLDLSSKSTSDLSEGTNLYYTQARFNTAFTAKSTSDLSEGTNLYYTDARADARITAADTDSLSEGSTNLYYTDARADARVALIVASAPSTLDTLNELAAALGDDANFSTTVTNSIATKIPIAGGTFTGQVIFPSAATTKPVLPNGFISRDDLTDTEGRHDIWGISEKYYPSNATTGDAWGIQWSGAPNDIVFVGSGSDIFTVSLDEGNVTAAGIITATGGNSTEWNTAYGWGDHASAGYITSFDITTQTDPKYLRSNAADTLSATITLDDNGYFVGSPSYGFRFNNSADTINALIVDNSGNSIAYASHRAPIFYDSNDTNAYINPNQGNLVLLESAEYAGGMTVKNAGASGYLNMSITTDSHADGWGWRFANQHGHTGSVTKYFWVTYSGGNAYASGSFRGPIFYDSDNTAFYVDPSNGSNGVSANLQGRIQVGTFSNSQANTGEAWIGRASDRDAGVLTVQLGTGTGRKFEVVDYNWTTVEFSADDSGVATAAASFRAPIFYDSNNTAYYVDPTGGSVLNGNVVINQASVSYTENDNTPVIGSNTTNRLHINGSIQLTNNDDAIVFGRSTASFMKDEEIGFGWGGGWYMTDGTYLRVRNNKAVYSTGYIYAGLYYDSDNTGFYVNPSATSNLSTLSTDTNEGIFNNQRRNHSTTVNFNDTSLRAGVNYLQQGSNGPTGTTAHQWYGWRLGLGGDYGTQTGSSGHYAQEWYVARKDQGGNNTGGNFLWTRDMESGSWGSWAKIDTDRLQLASGYSVVMGSWGLRNVTPSGYIEMGPANAGHAHIYTDRSNFYFNAQIILNGGSVINQNDIRAQIFYDLSDTTYYVDPSAQSGATSFYTKGDIEQTNIANSTWPYLFTTSGGSNINSSGFWTSSSGYPDMRLRRENGTVRALVSSWERSFTSFGFTDSTDMRAPIFYDSNDTNYYVNPNGFSSLWGLAIRGDNAATGTENQITFWGTGGSTTSAIGFKQNGGYFTNPTGSGDGYNTYFTMDTNGRGWVFRRGTGGTNFTAATTSGWILNNGVWQANASMRAPIFYDSNDTSYYANPAGLSDFHSIKTTSSVDIAPRWDTSFYVAQSQHYYGHTSTQTMYLGEANHVNIKVIADIHGQARAPIYYDRNNTAYYTRPSTSSNINSLYTAGLIQAGASGTGNIYIGGSSGNYFRFHTNNSHTYFDANVGDIHWRQGASTRFTFYMTSANMTINGSLTQNSDERVKENIVEIPNAIDKVKAMKGVYYNRTDFNTDVTKVGVLAQEVEAVLPELIVEAPDSGLKSVAYGELTAVLINAVKEQQTIIDDLKSRLETLENQ